MKKAIINWNLVRIRSHQTSSNTWNPGQVVEQCEEPRSYLVKSGDRTFKRNLRDCEPKKKISRSFADAGKRRLSSCRSTSAGKF